MGLKKRRCARKPKKLRTIFVGYLSVFCVVTLLLIALPIAACTGFILNGVMLPANHAEIQLSARKDRIADSETVTPDLIPDVCDYAVFTPRGKFLSGNLSAADAARAWKITQEEKENQYLNFFYLSIPRKNQICIVRYTYMMQFSSPILRRYLPRPEPLFFYLFCISFLLEIFLLASLFGKKLTRKMDSLQNATEKIQNRDLEFTVQSSGVLEIDHVLQSLDQMRDALKSSLKKQWDLEQARREQMAALAHDIKTPLTVARGNADLLSETDQTKEQKEYTAYIKESTCQMEQYIKLLIDLSKAELGYSLNKNPIDSKSFMDSILNQMTALGSVKKVTVHCETHLLPKSFNADSGLLQRALLNIVSNAVEFSPRNGKIDFTANAAQNHIRFCVTDCGKGFSTHDLKQATQQFYMGDKSRTSNAHYGMGLFIAKCIAEQHGGTLAITNSAVSGGGQVTIEIPY